MARSRGRDWSKGYKEITVYWLPPHGLFSLLFFFFYSTQGHLPWDGTALNQGSAH